MNTIEIDIDFNKTKLFCYLLQTIIVSCFLLICACYKKIANAQ